MDFAAQIKPAGQIHRSGPGGKEAPLQHDDLAGHRPLIQKVVIVDEHAVVRDGLKALLAAQADVLVIGETGDGYEALVLCRSMQPDVVIMDLHLPSLGGLELISLIRRRCPRVRILVLSGTVSEQRAAAALDSGAHGYVLKVSNIGTVKTALNELRKDAVYIDPLLSLQQIAGMRETGGEARGANTKWRLTQRERQILKLIAEGERNRDIAERLTISQKTVETHRLNMMQKLQAHNAAELSQWARRLGLMSD
jgi:two-component system secretion response regulator SsrB